MGLPDAKARLKQMPVPPVLDQLWDILCLAPPNYCRIHIACDPHHDSPGAHAAIAEASQSALSRTMTLVINKTLSPAPISRDYN